MLNKIKTYIKEQNLIPSNEKVVVAVSCGMDSMALLHILKDLGYEVIIAHVNHQKRDQSKIEEKYIIDYAKKENIICEVYHLEYDQNNNFHNEAHEKRYAFFKEVLKKHNASFLATAHHLQDNAETIILNMMRGSNLFGYGGISPKIEYDDYTIIRPLLTITKEEIKDYVTKNNIKYYDDESNFENDYKRNRVRHNILPSIILESPDFLNKITLFSNQIKQAFNYIRNESIKYLEQYQNNIDINSFKQLDVALKNDIICLLLEKYNINKNEEIIKDINKVIDSNSSSSSLDLSQNYCFYKRYGKGYINKKVNDINEVISLNINEEVIFNGKYRFYFSKNVTNCNAKYINLCYNDLVFPFSIRSYKMDDEILMSYGHKKLNRLFIDHKISKELRTSIPVIESGNEILWVYNLAKNKRVVEMKQNGNIYLICEEI